MTWITWLYHKTILGKTIHRMVVNNVTILILRLFQKSSDQGLIYTCTYTMRNIQDDCCVLKTNSQIT